MQITLKHIRTQPVIGLYSHERNRRQPILVNLWIEVSSQKAYTSDDIEDTLDYCKLTEGLVKAVNATEFVLIEKLMDFVLDHVLKEKLAKSVTCELIKPEALSLFADYVSIKDSRSK